jgi:tetratricopeptide (TPR) repeat protein
MLHFNIFLDLEEHQNQSNKLQLSATLNLAASYLKMKEYREALETCQKVLALDSNNEKGMFRMAQAYLGLGFEKEAITHFTKVFISIFNS